MADTPHPPVCYPAPPEFGVGSIAVEFRLRDPTSIAIDGPVASGKTAVGRLLAQRLGCRFVDTGAMYRAVTWAALDRGIDLEDEAGLTRLTAGLKLRTIAGTAGGSVTVDGLDITDQLKGPEVERGVSLVAVVSGVRAALVDQQRSMARQGPTVMVGRDIGTVVLPDAKLKVFLSASVEVRARRRHRELMQQCCAPDYQRVVDELVRRDSIDSARADSPLRVPEDAVQIETEGLNVDEVLGRIMSIVEPA